jgi:hypothetical protein
MDILFSGLRVMASSHLIKAQTPRGIAVNAAPIVPSSLFIKQTR